jgi:hypothetical protein
MENIKSMNDKTDLKVFMALSVFLAALLVFAALEILSLRDQLAGVL